MSTSKGSTTWHNMVLIMLILMRIRQSYSEKDLASRFRITWLDFVTCCSMLLWVPRLNKRVPTKPYWMNKRRRERGSCPNLLNIVLGCSTEVPPSLHSISWQVTSATATTIVGSWPSSATVGVTLGTYLVSSACITSLTSIVDCSSQRPVLQLWMCRTLCSTMLWT
jgi:hypothetical protein